ncbi:MAG: Asp-tRNA(Asn)/Glu-tRNA(Gln) amidotransferase subunit GatC [Mycoplasmataceae bacterium]|jgi:aspartyl/glutamyl-tRNA(Asn/Gln) amidotransferase C subunit|nr:Asp-tRNA(Asn)/Glu-tRNA(Gln) amidotransferase subunit GatC [Mycoplasmataceae bacterium]
MEKKKEELIKLTKILHFEMNETQLQSLLDEFDSVINKLKLLSNVDTHAVEPTYSPLKKNSTILREDIATTTDASKILENAPNKKGDFVVVK